MKTSTSWPRVASYFFNPLLIPSLAFLLLYAQPSYFSLVLPLRVKLMLLSVVFINTALLPLLSLVVLRRIGLIGSLTLEKREERLYPLLLGAILVYLTYFLFHRLSLPGIYATFLFGTALAALLLLVITWYYPISIHTTAMGGLSGMLLGMQLRGLAAVLPWLALVVVISGLVATARLLMKAHDGWQVSLGYLLGVVVMTACFLLF